MLNRWLVIAGAFCLPGVAGQSYGSPVLFNWGLKLSGSISTFAGSPLPSNIDTSGFDFNSRAGTVKIGCNRGAAGTYFIDTFFDHDLPLFGNEIGAVNETADAGQTWQIDEPGVRPFSGDGPVIANLYADTFDNTNRVPSNPPFDVSMGMGFRSALTAGQTADVVLSVTTTPPTSGFYFRQIDLTNTADQIYSRGSLNGSGGGAPIPEPGSAALSVFGVAAMLSYDV